jgi:hypothetical protein
MIATYPDDWQSLRNNARLITAFGQTGPAAMRDLERFLGLRDGDLDPLAGQRLCQAAGVLMRAQTRDYRSDPIFRARARPNPFHAAGAGPIERPAPKPAPLPPARPRRKPHADVTPDPEALKLDEALRRLFGPVIETGPGPDEQVPL